MSEDISDVKTKKCSRCQINKSYPEFGKNKYMPDGLHFYCKQCVRTINQDRYQEQKALMEQDKFESPEMKKCNQCSKVKPITEFNRLPTSADKYSNHCKDCHKAYCYERYQDPEIRRRILNQTKRYIKHRYRHDAEFRNRYKKASANKIKAVQNSPS